MKKVILPEMNFRLYARAVEHLIPPTSISCPFPRVDGELLTVEEVVTKGDLM